jgi:thiamine kinase-like enzyme
MPIKQLFANKGHNNIQIIDERVGILNLVYTIKSGEHMFYYKRPEKTSELSKNLSKDRILNEWQAMQLVQKVIPEHLPPIFDFDPINKSMITQGPIVPSSILRFDLLEGKLDIEIVKQLARTLRKIHSVTTGNLNRELFDKVKLDFLYKPIQQIYPEIGQKLIDNVNERKCLVHADFNPKNIIVMDDNIWVIDWEQALMSSPEQDIGNMLGHYVIKGIHLGREDYLKVPEIFMDAYGGGIDRNLVNGHIGVTLWCRINTSARARYLTPETIPKVSQAAHKYLTQVKLS